MAASSCTPKIYEFSTTPERICVGQHVALEWNVRGKANLSTQPRLPATSGIGSHGVQAFRIPATTQFTLTAVQGDQRAVAEREVEAYPGQGEVKRLGGTTACLHGGVETKIEVPVSKWDDVVKVSTLSSDGSRTLIVDHEGRRTMLTAERASSRAFDGMRTSGSWTVFSPLLPGEACGDRESAPPSTLDIAVMTRCEP